MQIRNAHIKKQAWKTLPFWMAAFISSLVLLAGSSGSIMAGCMNLADQPLEIQSMGAPGMIMFMYDNSGSMKFTVMTPETEGSFHTPSQNTYYGYCFLYDPDYGSNDLPTLQGSGDEMYWKSQWSGYNTIYYNPSVQYEPWPSWTKVAHVASIPACAPQADPDNPLTDVVKSSTTFNLSGIWKTLSVGGSTNLDDLINTKGIIVDNTDSKSVSPIYVDDEGDGTDEPGFSFTGDVWRWNRFSDQGDYYHGDYMNYYGDTNPLPVKATWTFDVAVAGNYEVIASVSKYSTRTAKANYTITHQGVSTVQTISQRINGGPTQAWVSLGSYDFNAGTGAGKVELNFTDAKSGASISVDAIELRPTFTTGTSNKYFTGSPNWVPWDYTGWGAFQGSNFLYSGYLNSHYTASWTAENLTSNSKYNAYVRWVSFGSYSSKTVNYTVDGTVITENQENHSGDASSPWSLLKANIDFGHSNTGVVQLNDYLFDSTDRFISADAVAFLPSSLLSSGTALNVVMAHYFVKGSDGNTYLVNLDGAIKYYKVTDSNGNDKVEDGELAEVSPADAQAVGIVSGKTYAQERQNFANWFQFARSRNLVSKYAVGTLVTRMGNIYFGFTAVPSRDFYALRAIRDAKVLNRDDTLLALNNIYNLADPSGGTPLKDGFMKVGAYFEGTNNALINAADLKYFTDGGYSDVDSYPYLNQANGGNCQQAFMIAMTDGWYNSNTASNVGNYDGDNSSQWDGGEYGDTYSGTLADISMHFYERDLKPDTILTNNVPTNEWDQNNAQHVVTYALSFGTHGTIDPNSSTWVHCPSATGVGQSCGTWPFPVDSTSTTIDDLYHATVNGRGMFLNAGNPQELVDALMKIKANIEARLGSSAAVSTNSVQRQIGSKLYRGEYMTGKWSGDINAYNIDVNTGAVDTTTSVWSAAKELAKVTDYTTRKIYSFNGSAGIKFDSASMTPDQMTRLKDGLTYAFGTTASYAFGTVDDTDAQNVVKYIAGDRSKEQTNGGPFRTRVSVLGDIVHSEAEYYNRVLYVGSNDGMVHAFHSETGVELGAYVPNMLYYDLPKLAYPQYQHQYFIDNTPSVTNTGTQTLLVCPMGKGHKGLFMLDVSAPMGEADYSKVGLWEYPGAGNTDPDLGYTYSYASIVKTEAAGWVVVTGNGYDSDNGHAILYVFNALTGAVLAKLDTGVGGCNGLSSPAIIDPDGNGVIDYAYAGDLKGNMWKFDLTGAAVSDWKIAFKDGATPKPLITVTGPSGNIQAITNMPAVMFVSKCNPPGSKGYLIVFGTGKYLGVPDLADVSKQSVYGVYDWGPDWVIKTALADGDADKFLGTFDATRSLANASLKAGKTLNLVQQTVSTTTATAGGDTYRFISNNPVVYYNVEANTGSALGWYVDLPDSGERMFHRPVIRNNVFLFIANIPEKSVCSAGGRSVFYELDACTGGWPVLPQFDTNGDGKIDANDLINGQTPIGKEYNTMLLDVTILDDKAYTPDADAGEIGFEDLTQRHGTQFWQIIE